MCHICPRSHHINHDQTKLLQQILGAQEETSHMHSGNQKRLFIAHPCQPSRVTSKGWASGWFYWSFYTYVLPHQLSRVTSKGWASGWFYWSFYTYVLPGWAGLVQSSFWFRATGWYKRQARFEEAKSRQGDLASDIWLPLFNLLFSQLSFSKSDLFVEKNNRHLLNFLLRYVFCYIHPNLILT